MPGEIVQAGCFHCRIKPLPWGHDLLTVDRDRVGTGAGHGQPRVPCGSNRQNLAIKPIVNMLAVS